MFPHFKRKKTRTIQPMTFRLRYISLPLRIMW